MNLHEPKWTLQWLTSNLPVTCQWLIGDSSVEQLNGRVERKLLPITCSVVALNNINQYHIIISWHLLLRSFKLLVSSHWCCSKCQGIAKSCKIMSDHPANNDHSILFYTNFSLRIAFTLLPTAYVWACAGQDVSAYPKRSTSGWSISGRWLPLFPEVARETEPYFS